MVPDGHILIFIRHGKRGRVHPDDDLDPLIPRGIAQAERAGDWLRAGGHIPTKLLYTKKRRTQETAEIIRERLGPEHRLLPMARVSAGPTADTLEAFAEKHGSGAAIVAHHTSHEFIVKTFCKPDKYLDDNGAGFVLQKGGDTWQCVARHAGES
ncbi:hypothetical protein LBMAG42_00980 [Deltaproteobacteria bacterium]|nr:hypothetical protein LBMAG42_00980 [Deltaproteobacteria bacterium]